MRQRARKQAAAGKEKRCLFAKRSGILCARTATAHRAQASGGKYGCGRRANSHRQECRLAGRTRRFGQARRFRAGPKQRGNPGRKTLRRFGRVADGGESPRGIMSARGRAAQNKANGSGLPAASKCASAVKERPGYTRYDERRKRDNRQGAARQAAAAFPTAGRGKGQRRIRLV